MLKRTFRLTFFGKIADVPASGDLVPTPWHPTLQTTPLNVIFQYNTLSPICITLVSSHRLDTLLVYKNAVYTSFTKDRFVNMIFFIDCLFVFLLFRYCIKEEKLFVLTLKIEQKITICKSTNSVHVSEKNRAHVA